MSTRLLPNELVIQQLCVRGVLLMGMKNIESQSLLTLVEVVPSASAAAPGVTMIIHKEL